MTTYMKIYFSKIHLKTMDKNNNCGRFRASNLSKHKNLKRAKNFNLQLSRPF